MSFFQGAAGCLPAAEVRVRADAHHGAAVPALHAVQQSLADTLISSKPAIKLNTTRTSVLFLLLDPLAADPWRA